MTERPFVGYNKNDQASFGRHGIDTLQLLKHVTSTLQEISQRFQGSETKIDLDNQSETLTIPKTSIFGKENYIRYQITDNGLKVTKRLGRRNMEKITSYFLERMMKDR